MMKLFVQLVGLMVTNGHTIMTMASLFIACIVVYGAIIFAETGLVMFCLYIGLAFCVLLFTVWIMSLLNKDRKTQ